jgi:hypothetical protein
MRQVAPCQCVDHHGSRCEQRVLQLHLFYKVVAKVAALQQHYCMDAWLVFATPNRCMMYVVLDPQVDGRHYWEQL